MTPPRTPPGEPTRTSPANPDLSSHPLWRSLSVAAVYESLGTSERGLSASEAALRLYQQGYNERPEPPQRLLWRVASILAFLCHTPELGWAIWASDDRSQTPRSIG